jgi:DNA (cytosine-5)-methyltransferase 1
MKPLSTKYTARPEEVLFLIIDLFCGAGGTTTGFEMAMLPSLAVNAKGQLINICITAACVNHDPWAIEAHAANHPHVLHFTEDITTLNLDKLIAHINQLRKKYPNAKMILWASLECTNFSNAKGGKPRDADSRSLADHMPRYIQALSPDYFMVENVREFMSWGPLDEKGKPVSRTAGRDYQRWIREICEVGGFRHDHKLLNAADFGAYTSRLRYFGIFGKEGLPIAFPKPTHAKRSGKVTKQSDMFGTLKPWKAVRDVLDFSDEGQSIFTRKTGLSEKTLERIYAGLIKHVAGGSTSFLSKYYSGKPEGKNISVDGPAGSITTVDSHAVVQPAFLVKYLGNDAKTGINNGVSIDEPCVAVTTQNRLYLAQCTPAFIVQRQNDVEGKNPSGRVVSLDGPSRTVTTTGGNQELVQTNFIQEYYGKGETRSVEEPASTITTKDRLSLIQTEHFVDQQYGNSKPSSVEDPAGTLTQNPKLNLVQADRFLTNYYTGGGQTSSVDEPTGAVMTNPHQRLVALEKAEGFLSNPGWFGASSDLDQPAPTVIARQDKAPVSVVQCEPFIMTNQHSNAAKSINEPAPTILTGNHHYLLNAQFNHSLRSLDEVHPVVTADRHWPYLVVTESGQLAIQVLESDSPATVKIKQFMAAYGIIDIKMRMLKIPELKRIQGFPEDYILKGSQTIQKKHIGNAVVKDIPQYIAQVLGAELRKLFHSPLNTFHR